MVKKIFGVLFILFAVLSIIGGIANGSLFAEMDSVAATYGSLLGKVIALALFVWSGIFLITFDNVHKKAYAEGFEKRGSQCVAVIVFLCIYAFFTLVSASVAGKGLDSDQSFTQVLLYTYLLMIPYMIPFIVFCAMCGAYVVPYFKTKKLFPNDAHIKEYLKTATFRSCTKDNSVLVNNEVLFFTKIFSVIPLTKIETIKKYQQLAEKGVSIKTTNGKKISFMTSQYEDIIGAVEAYKNR